MALGLGLRRLLVFGLVSGILASLPAPALGARRGSRKTRRPAAKSALAPVLKSLEILPGQVSLAGPRSRQLLVVTAVYSDGTLRDVSSQARYVSSRPGVASVSTEGLVRPAADGMAVVKVSLGKVTAQVPVRVSGGGQAPEVSFVREIVPLLTQAGCNSLACHGSPAGRAGFKLSMYGYEPSLDFDAITKQERAVPEKGKRVDPSAPEKSLVLLKPTMQVPHQGGMRFKPGSPEHETLLAWLRSGAATETADPPVRAARLELLPGERVLPAAGAKQRLVVMAHYSDGSSEDVTHRSVYASNDDAVAVVDAAGRVAATGTGETAILVRYLGRVGLAQLLVPQPAAVPEKQYAAFKPVNYVDTLALAKWKKLRFAPSEICTDLEFLRRVRLDLTGMLPSPDEIRKFAADPAPDRRAKKIDELLASSDYADWWTLFWGDTLRNNSRFLLSSGARAFRDWIRQSIADNKPYDQFVREMVTATGVTGTVGPANFYAVARTPADRGEQVAQVFLGVRLQCANCHNHPFEKWTRSSYHQFAALFSRISSRGQGQNGFDIQPQAGGEYRHPETNQVVAPAVLDDGGAPIPTDKERREALAEWLVNPGNPLFSRNLVNRIWAQLFGHGIVEPVDDVRATNPPVNEPLLDALAKDFLAQKSDVRHVLRTLANSRAYQLSVRANPLNQKDRQSFSRAYHRRLKAEALLDAICQATGVPENFQGHPAGTRAVQLVDNRVQSYFMDIFGRPRREVVCTCEREEAANITQALHLINGNTLNSKLASDRGRIAEMVKAGKADRDMVEELYLWTVSRPPSPDEAASALREIEIAPAKKRHTLEDLLWVLLNSTEFLFNH
jgi:hypothetical protein